jgi:hypothetical protein
MGGAEGSPIQKHPKEFHEGWYSWEGLRLYYSFSLCGEHFFGGTFNGYPSSDSEEAHKERVRSRQKALEAFSSAR